MYIFSALVIALLFIWHLSWNIALNIARNFKSFTSAQLIVSLFVAVLAYLMIDWSVWLPTAYVALASIGYYINLVHIRYFGTLISFSQINQLLFSGNKAGNGSGMLLKGALRLIKWRDISLLLLVVSVVFSLFYIAYEPLNDTFAWVILNGLLLVLILHTIKQVLDLNKGTIKTHTFGMFFSYYFSWLLLKQRKHELAQMHKQFADEEQANNESIDGNSINDEWFGKFKDMNVILIQLESFQKFLLHHKVEGQEVTPFMNKLAREHISFTDVFSQYAMGHTCDAELAVLQSLYPLKNDVVNYKHYDKKFHGVPHIFKEHGYHVNAYHGYKGDFYNRRTMMDNYGFEKFYSEEDYLLSDLALNWLSDDSFFDQSIEKIKGMKRPFFSFMISLTSHFPFNLEERHWSLSLSNDVPEDMKLYYQSVNYTDRAMQRFYERLEEEGLLENTVFAFYGDHEGVTIENLPKLYDELNIQQSNIIRNINRMHVAQVPFVIACGDPSRQTLYTSDMVGSTLDVGQTLLHLLGLPKISYGMGESLFRVSRDRVIPLVQHPLGSFATHETLCYVIDSGNYANSTIYDRSKEIINLPLSGINKHHFEYSKQQVSKSEYLISNDLLVTTNSHDKHNINVSFTPVVERMLSIIDDKAMVIPISYSMDLMYLEGQNNDIESMRELERLYQKTRKKNIRFYSTLENDISHSPLLYFADNEYEDKFIERGYIVESLKESSLQYYLSSIIDHSLIIVSVSDDGSNQFTPSYAKEMFKYGFNKLDRSKFRHSYINVIYKNRGYLSLHEEVSTLSIEKKWERGTLLNGISLPVDLEIVSQGALAGSMSGIKVDGKTCSLNLRGLNFTVIDLFSNKVIDICRADTYITTFIDNGMYKATKKEIS